VAWAKVQSAKATSVTPAATISKAFTSNVTAGNRVFVYVSETHGGSSFPNAPTDTQGNTYTQLFSIAASTDNPWGAVYTAAMASTGANTVTVATGAMATPAGGMLAFSMQEFSGLSTAAGTGCADVYATAAPYNLTSGTLATTAATTAANQLAVAWAADWGQSATFTTASTGWTKDTGASADADTNSSRFVATKLSPSGTAETITLANNTGTDQIVGAVFVIKLAAAASNPTSRPQMTSQAVRRAAFF
jgi:hypothetical protein